MLKIQPTPKQISKYYVNQANCNYPKNWGDFAPLTRIRSGRGYCSFVPYSYQIQLAEIIDKHQFTQVVKGRQLGISEVVLSIFLHKCLTNEGIAALIISRTATDAFALAKRLRESIQTLGIKLVYDSLSEMQFSNGSRLYFRAGENAGRGLPSAQYILLDEFAFYGDLDEIVWSSALPSTEMLGDDLRVVIVSTPNGKNNQYYRFLTESNGSIDVMGLIQEVRDGKHNGFTYFKDQAGWGKAIISYHSHPIYSKRTDYLKWIYETKKISWSRVQREYNLDFSEGLYKWLDESLVFSLATGTWKNKPEENARYVFSLDTATTGKDWLVGLILEILLDGTRSVVGIARGRKQGFERNINKLKALIDLFQPVHGAVESNAGGILYLERLIKEYPDVNWIDIKTTTVSRPVLLDGLALAIESQSITYPPGEIAQELADLEEINGKIQAPNGCHDDAAMALAFALSIADLPPPKPPTDFFEGLNIDNLIIKRSW